MMTPEEINNLYKQYQNEYAKKRLTANSGEKKEASPTHSQSPVPNTKSGCGCGKPRLRAN
ncbi:hypothetical protein J2S09_004046 [Bacillus fengqiuensis]|nr:hypothetical protein [Bacillus fengqiuensis]